jgi:hypothetical protein
VLALAALFYAGGDAAGASQVPALALHESDGICTDGTDESIECASKKGRNTKVQGTWKTGGFKGREQRGQCSKLISMSIFISVAITAPPPPFASCFTSICSHAFLALPSPSSIVDGEPLVFPSELIPTCILASTPLHAMWKSKWRRKTEPSRRKTEELY